ncbi:MAG: hypothetical protein ACOH1P_03925 [Lysobacter sp.]
MSLYAVVLAAVFAVVSIPAHAQSKSRQSADAGVAQLSQQLIALDANPDYANAAAYERLQARQAIDALASARSSQVEGAFYVAQRRVQIAEVAARTALMRQQTQQLDRERSELLVEASRRDAAQARAEAERLRVEAQIQAEEAARLRQQGESNAEAMADVETALKGVAGAQAAKLRAAKAREAELARQEAELLGKKPAKTDQSKKK